nr:hypothetical protein [Tanacetum cinerariifolium]
MTESPLVDSSFAVPVFYPRDDLITCLNKAMVFLTAVASSRGDKGKVILVLGKRVMLLVLGKTMQVDKKGLLNATIVKTEDLDTYDSDCDDISNAKAVLMANISNYGSDVISELPHSETYLNDMENQRLKCSTSNCRSKPSCNKKNDKISQTTSRNIKNKVEVQPRNVNKKNHVVEPIHNVNVKQSQLEVDM